nr:hypothetical protein [Tanacetum cinerariifolium]
MGVSRSDINDELGVNVPDSQSLVNDTALSNFEGPNNLNSPKSSGLPPPPSLLFEWLPCSFSSPYFPLVFGNHKEMSCNTPILTNIAAEANLGYYFMCTLPTQGMRSIISMVSISPKGFMPSILLLVVIIVTVVIVVVTVILVVVVVAIIRVVIVVTIIGVIVVVVVSSIIKLLFIIGVIIVVVSSIIKLSFVIIGIPPGQGILGKSTSRKFHFVVLDTVATRKYRFSSFKPTNETNSSFHTIEVERLATYKLLLVLPEQQRHYQQLVAEWQPKSSWCYRWVSRSDINDELGVNVPDSQSLVNDAALSNFEGPNNLNSPKSSGLPPPPSLLSECHGFIAIILILWFFVSGVLCCLMIGLSLNCNGLGGDNNKAFAASGSVGASGGILSMWDTHVFNMEHKVIDINFLDSPDEHLACCFDANETGMFNDFISRNGLFDFLLCGKRFMRFDKEGRKASEGQNFKPKPFKVFDKWLHDAEFMEMVENLWASTLRDWMPEIRLKNKIKRLRNDIKDLKAKNALVTQAYILKKEELIMDLNQIEQLHREDLRQKSRLRADNGTWIESPDEIKLATMEHVSLRFKEHNYTRPYFYSLLFRKLSPSKACYLESNFTMEEVRALIRSLKKSKKLSNKKMTAAGGIGTNNGMNDTIKKEETLLQMLKNQSGSIKKINAKYFWIIDSGASHHMTCIIEDLSKLKEIVQWPVELPDGNIAMAKKEGDVCFDNGFVIRNVLCVLGLTCNLLSVPQLLDEGNCIVQFAPNICVIHDLTSRTMIGTGKRKDGGLFYFREISPTRAFKTTRTLPFDLWHKLLGHPSLEVLKPLPQVNLNKKEPIVPIINENEYYNTGLHEEPPSQDRGLLEKNENPTYYEAIKDKRWRAATDSKLEALERNQTWTIEELPSNKKALGCKWVYKIKYKSYGTINRFKVRLVILDNHQLEGIDYNETFTPVAKMVIVRVFLAIAASKQWELHRMDVHNAFLHGDLEEEVFMKLQPGLNKDYSLFTLRQNEVQLNVLVYVDDLIISENDSKVITQFKTYLSDCFHMKDLASLLGAKPTKIPMEQNHRFGLAKGRLFENPEQYRRLEFKMERGLRQGDHLSPFLLLIVVEALQVFILEACNKGFYNGLSLANSDTNVPFLLGLQRFSSWYMGLMDIYPPPLEIWWFGCRVDGGFNSPANTHGVGSVWCDILKAVKRIESIDVSFNRSFSLSILWFQHSFLERCLGENEERLMAWRSPPRDTSFDDLNSLLSLISSLASSLALSYNNEDEWVWDYETGTFKVKTLSRRLQDLILIDHPLGVHHVWNSRIPQKVNICVWRASIDRLATRSNLSHRGVPLKSTVCPFCKNFVEDIHCLIRYPSVLSVWRKAWSWWNLDSPVTFLSFGISDFALGLINGCGNARLSKVLHVSFKSPFGLFGNGEIELLLPSRSLFLKLRKTFSRHFRGLKRRGYLPVYHRSVSSGIIGSLGLSICLFLLIEG